MRLKLLALLLAYAFAAVPTQADPIPISPDQDWAAAINRLAPGDTAQLSAGRYTARASGDKVISIQGTEQRPIVLRGAGHRQSIFDGQQSDFALRLDDCEHVILENVGVTNPSPFGIDGRAHYNTDAAGKPTGRSQSAEGVIVKGGRAITIRASRFADIATRGILAHSGVDGLTVTHNLFIRVGDDTAGADLAAGRPTQHVTVRENLFAGNVDGVMFEGPDGGNLIERNLIVFHRWEDGIDLKLTGRNEREQEPGDRWTVVRRNVIYAQKSQFSGLTIQLSTDNVKAYENVIHGHAGMHGARDGGNAVMIRARNGDTENLEIVGNWLDGGFGNNPGGRGIRMEFDGRRPGHTLRDVLIAHNVISGFFVGLSVVEGTGVQVANNIFSDTAIKVDVADITGRANLYDRTDDWAGKTRVWSDDERPIRGRPIYAAQPVGVLAESSPGYGEAASLPARDWGDNVGLPPSAADLPELEASILQVLETCFSEAEIREALKQGGLDYEPVSGLGAAPFRRKDGLH